MTSSTGRARSRGALNPWPLLEWNTDKRRYLTDLAAAGVPVVPTVFVDPGAELEPLDGPFVVKPAISAGGRRSARFEQESSTPPASSSPGSTPTEAPPWSSPTSATRSRSA